MAEPTTVTELAGWLPAVILPLSTAIQLARLLRERTGAGTSIVTWGLFAVANFGAYAFTGRPAAIQSILAFLLTGLLDVAIVATLVLIGRGRLGPRSGAPARFAEGTGTCHDAVPDRRKS